jgi:hypothetical protein
VRPPHCVPRRFVLPALAIAALASTPASLLAQFPQGPEFRVNTYTTGEQRRPAASRLGQFGDTFVVAWESDGQDGDQEGIFAREYNSFGTPTGPEFRVNTYSTSSQHGVSVESSPTKAVFVWQSDGQDGDLGGIFAQRWSGGPLGGEFRVNSYTTSSQGAPAVAVDGSGNFVVVWASLGQDGSDSGIFGQRFSVSGAPLGGEFQVNTYTTGFQGHPSVAVDNQVDRFVVAWEGQGAGDEPFGIYAQQYFGNGTPVGGEFRVNGFTSGDQRYPRVNAGTGNFLVVWESDGQDGSGLGVFTGNGSQDVRINTYTTGAQNRPALWSRAFGNNVWVWQSDDNQDPQGGVFGQFAYGLSPIMSEFRANTYTTGTQGEPVVIVANDVVVAWSSQQDPDGSRGIYAQRYNPPWLPVELRDFTVE